MLSEGVLVVLVRGCCYGCKVLLAAWASLRVEAWLLLLGQSDIDLSAYPGIGCGVKLLGWG